MENYNFIENYENALSDDLCDKIIDIFEENKSYHIDRPKAHIDLNIKDTSISLLDLQKDKEVIDLLYTIDDVLRKCYDKYTQKYKESDLHRNMMTKKPLIREFKVQKTLPGEGFLAWHHERYLGGSEHTEKRFLVYSIYLNDINDGGETEFLYQKMLVPPKKGTVCLFPAEFTHVHRGNTPKKEIKYILTGWFFQKNL